MREIDAAHVRQLALEAGYLNACVTEQLVRFASGHAMLDEFDERLIDMLLERVSSSEFRFDELVLELAADDAIRFRREEE